LRTPRIGLRVVCGLGEVIETFSPTSRFTRVLFPTFGLPTTATKPLL
jgi:ABC-type enterochelin transport system substrate-binding protein